MIDLMHYSIGKPETPKASSIVTQYKQDMIRYTLSKSVFGAELKASDIEELVKVCNLCSLSKDEFLFHQGEAARCFYVVHSGAVKVHRLMPDGREQVIQIFKPWDSFAEIGAFWSR